MYHLQFSDETKDFHGDKVEDSRRNKLLEQKFVSLADPVTISAVALVDGTVNIVFHETPEEFTSERNVKSTLLRVFHYWHLLKMSWYTLSQRCQYYYLY